MDILIVGGTGSLGRELTRFYTERGWNVTVYSRDPHKQATLRRGYPNVDFYLGDVCDYDLMARACEGQDIVIHAAALKLVDMGEIHVDEYIRVNITGSQTVARACCDSLVPRALLISTDKSPEALNLYGKTKSVAESVFLSMEYSALRYGNVASSDGSFINVWREKLRRGEKITLRKPIPTRFLLSMQDAVDLVDNAINLPNGLYIPHSLKSFSVEDAARFLGFKEWNTEYLLRGEKVHEILLAQDEQGMKKTDLLCHIWQGYDGDLDHREFCSQTAPRVDRDEFLEKTGFTK